ncbi:hypothetical protein [Microvirga makkahensis]|uniref:Uncharacterized protein n=1 Tax=Microvirga makkahensis TaxID=1128670 RepID=A0A7X3MX33_9HYPH|nr:hypothetical protein [Microvirga makkahensis]MXQ14873.1 hypothetical protein [Microvirga makkahensis]
MPQVERLDLLVERLHEMNSGYDLRYLTGYALSLPKPEESLTIARA